MQISHWPIPLLSLLLSASLLSCGSPEVSGQEVQERVPGTGSADWQNEARTRPFLSEAVAVRINAKTNMITYYESGTPRSRWKVATGRSGYGTPKGIFRIHHKDVCPPWSRAGLSAGPCAPNNPLGKKALWFNESFTYGMHGVDEAHLWTVTTENPRDRDQSSGCVRNHPDNIEWLFARVRVGTPVVVGLWDTDPAVVDCSGRTQLCAGSGSDGVAPVSRLPSALPSWCGLSLSGDGLANVRQQATTASEAINQLGATAKVRVEAQVSGQAVDGNTSWYRVSFTLGGQEQSGFLHSSLLDCTR